MKVLGFFFNCLNIAIAVVYVGKLEDGTIVERQGSDEEPFEYVCAEGALFFHFLLQFISSL